MAASEVLDLRNLLAERFPQARSNPATHLPTNLPPLDDVTQGGLRKGAITELITPHVSAGSALLIHHLLQTAARDHYFLGLIDGRDSFDPQPHDPFRLRHLLWVRCQEVMEAVKAADLLLRDGNFPLVILDLVLNTSAELRKISQTNWYRLQRLVEGAPTAFLILTRQSIVASAHVKLVLENQWRLSDLENESNILRLQWRVQRIQRERLSAEAG